MSKLYNKYEKLKSEDLECIYLFLCGNFYIALDSDAIMLNELFDMKLTKFSNLCDKCVFPINSLEKYEKRLKDINIKYKLINEVSDTNKIEKIKLLVNIDNIENLENEDLVNIVKTIKTIIME